jgi:hypothetical protein
MTAATAIPDLMKPAPSEPFTFDRELHICRDMKGIWIPSTTQILSAQGLSTDWNVVAYRIGHGNTEAGWDKIDRKSKLGSEVHDLTDLYDEFGGFDPSWLTDENQGYCESWAGFVAQHGFVSIYRSYRFVVTVNGLRWTGEIDNFGLLQGKYPALLDKKCSEFPARSWGYQLASYELGFFRSPRCGRVIRANVQLKADGSPGRLIEHKDHENDAGQFMAALVNVTERIKHGLLLEPTGE